MEPSYTHMNRAEILLAKRLTKAGKMGLKFMCSSGPQRFLPPRLEQHSDPNGRPLILVRKNVWKGMCFLGRCWKTSGRRAGRCAPLSNRTLEDVNADFKVRNCFILL